jgi:hypothetical protein
MLKPKTMQREILPESIDIAGLAKRTGLPELQIMRSIRSAERRGEAFSRIDPALRLRWYWTVRQAIPDAGGVSDVGLSR